MCLIQTFSRLSIHEGTQLGSLELSNRDGLEGAKILLPTLDTIRQPRALEAVASILGLDYLVVRQEYEAGILRAVVTRDQRK